MPLPVPPDNTSVARAWHVVHVRSGRELVAATLLEEHLHLIAHPLEVLQRRRGRLQPTPLFPGYVLVTDNGETARLEAIDATPGCGRLVRTGRAPGAGQGEPVQLLDREVDRLIQRVAAINASGGLPAHSLHMGQTVRVVRGPLQGLEAVFVGPLTPAARVQILLQFLGRQQQVGVEIDDIEPSAPLKRPRRTRGNGRRIGA